MGSPRPAQPGPALNIEGYVGTVGWEAPGPAGKVPALEEGRAIRQVRKSCGKPTMQSNW